MRFDGTLTELQDLILLTGIYGEWEEKPNGVWRFVTEDRAGLNWSSTKGTLWFDGPVPVRNQLRASFAASQAARKSWL